MRKLFVGMVMAAVATIGFGAVAFADVPTPNIPNCQAGHGAFTYFSDPSLHGIPGNGQPPYFGDSVLGSAPGGVTGDNNADYSAYCNNL